MTEEQEYKLRVKRVSPGKIRVDDFENVVVSEEVIKEIEKREVGSLTELIGKDRKSALHRLAVDYWKT
jgi:hypothetical protein